MMRLRPWVVCLLSPTLVACLGSKNGPPEFLLATGITRTKPANRPSNDFAGAAITLASAVTATAVHRKVSNICYASCQTGTTCDTATGMCVPMPCGGKCPADYRCKVVEGKETCVLEMPDQAAAPPPASSAPPESSAPAPASSTPPASSAPRPGSSAPTLLGPRKERLGTGDEPPR